MVRTQTRRSLLARLAAISAVTAGALTILVPNPARGQSGTTLSAKLGGVAVAGSKEGRSVALSPGLTTVDLVVTNGGTSPMLARTFRLSSSVMGLHVFSNETAVQVRVAPGATEERRFQLDLSGLKGQASGLLAVSLSLLDAQRHQLVSQDAVIDLHAPKFSVYGVFGLILLILSGAGLLNAMLALARGRLSPNRWHRAVLFLVPGFGLGLALVIGFSVFSVFAPSASRWGPILFVTAVATFALGYLTPTPDNLDEPQPDEDPGAAEPTTVAEEPATVPSRSEATTTLPSSTTQSG